MPLEAKIEQVGDGSAVVTINGTLTLGTGLKTVDELVQTLIERGTKWIVFDLGGVPYADSAGLGLLVHTYGLLQEKGGSVRLCGTSERVMTMLKMTKTDAFLPADADRAASVSALR